MTQDTFRALPPLELGGVRNRQGIDFQDHVAARFFLDMVDDISLLEVWCESQDDITLVWLRTGKEHVEYVQVKGQQSTAWSVAVLCSIERSDKKDPDSDDDSDDKPKKSILEKSLANDRSNDSISVSFRLVTRYRAIKSLGPLTCPIGHPDRTSGNKVYVAMCFDFIDRLPDAKSANGNNVLFWVENAFIENAGEETHLIATNHQKLDRLSADVHGSTLHHQQRDQLYSNLIRFAFEAGKSSITEEKRWTRDKFIEWFEQQVHVASKIPIQPPKSGKLKDKMDDAELAALYTQAFDQRMVFRQWRLSPSYMSKVNPSEVETRVDGVLQT